MSFFTLLPRFSWTGRVVLGLFLVFSGYVSTGWCDSGPEPSKARDTLTFENGDTLHGQLEREVAGTVYFNSDVLGPISVPWSKIQSLRTGAGFVVLENKPGVRHRAVDAARGTLEVYNGLVRISPGSVPAAAENTQAAGQGTTVHATLAPIAVKHAQFILDERTFDRQVRGEPNFFEGWNGSATAGVTLVQATQDQRTYTSEIALVRTVPTVSWLTTRNRTQADFSSSYGKIRQPAYTSGGTLVPASSTKSSIFHADAERDQYFSNRVFVLAQTAFDHNYSQGLDLQQIYGAGVGVTVLRRPTQQLDLKATLQYEKQQFIAGSSNTNQNLIGSTLSGTYQLKLKSGIVFDQEVAYLPAFNNPRAYSANETDSLEFPLYKNLAFTLGTIDTYLNDPLTEDPPTKRNSFQFTSGVTYTIKSKY